MRFHAVLFCNLPALAAAAAVADHAGRARQSSSCRRAAAAAARCSARRRMEASEPASWSGRIIGQATRPLQLEHLACHLEAQLIVG